MTLEPIQEFIIGIVPLEARKRLRSGALAKATGVSPDTIRHYERIGILPKAPRTDAGYRVYPESAIHRVLVARRALDIGFTLAELAEALKERDAGGAPCHRIYALAEEKLAAMERDIVAMQETASQLRSVLQEWNQRLQRNLPKQPAHLLYSLSLAPKAVRAAKSSLRRGSSS